MIAAMLIAIVAYWAATRPRRTDAQRLLYDQMMRARGELATAKIHATLTLHKAMIVACIVDIDQGIPLENSAGFRLWVMCLRALEAMVRGTPAEHHVRGALSWANKMQDAQHASELAR